MTTQEPEPATDVPTASVVVVAVAFYFAISTRIAAGWLTTGAFLTVLSASSLALEYR